MPPARNMMPRIIHIIAIKSLRDLMIPIIPIPSMSTPTMIGNFILKFNNNNSLRQNLKIAVHSDMHVIRGQ